MASSVIIYTEDEIRADLLKKILNTFNLSVVHFSNYYETRKAMEAHKPQIAILDIKTFSPGELKFAKSLSTVYTDTDFLILSSNARSSSPQILNRSNEIYISGPLDPEIIQFRIKDSLRLKKNPRTKARMKNKPHRRLLGVRSLIKTATLATAIGLGVIGGFLLWSYSTLPDLKLLEEYKPFQASKLYALDNSLLKEFYVEKRTFIPIDEIPEHVKNAFISIEDINYYKHHGIDLVRLVGALIRNIDEGAFVQGGSTITQQLVKMLFLTPDKTLTRKTQEIMLAVKMERKYSKDEILGLYLNQTYFGTRAYGIEAASEIYFAKRTKYISIAEAALLASLPKAPALYSPYSHPERSKQRRDFVLRKMQEKGFIDDVDLRKGLNTPLPGTMAGSQYRIPYFVDYCRSELEKKYGARLFVSGLQIYGTLNPGLQKMAEDVVLKGVAELEKRGRKDVQAALLAVELDTGKIRAMVGGTDFWTSQFNRATQALRQPGSAFKPLVFVTALDMGYTPESMIRDELRTYVFKRETWTPHNYSPVYYGDVSLKTALCLSLNAATVDLARKINIRNVVKTAEKMGIQSPVYPYYSSALGASEITLIELVYAYAALARGERMEPVFVEKIIDPDKKGLLEPQPSRESVFNERVLKSIRLMLRANVLQGTAQKAQVLKRPVYGKTGTTNDFADAWFIGFDDTWVVGIWVGRDSRKPIGREETGGRAALPIWIDFMQHL